MIKIKEVIPSNLDNKLFQAGSIDVPTTEQTSEVYNLEISGFLLSTIAQEIKIELIYQGLAQAITEVKLPRPDVAALYLDLPHATQCGYLIRFSTFHLAEEFEIVLEAVFSDKSRVRVGTILGSQQLLRSEYSSKLNPLMISGLGRSGSTWLMHLLAEHPTIIAERTYPYEVRNLTYWLQALRVLSAPADFQNSEQPEANSLLDPYRIGHNPYSNAMSSTVHPVLKQWLAQDYPRHVATFCQNNLENFYQHLATIQNKSGPVYFAEKCIVGPMAEWVQQLAWNIYPQTREIILVRDPRDLLCSVLAFNAKRGAPAFGFDAANNSVEAYIAMLQTDLEGLLESWHYRNHQAYLLRYEDLILQPDQTLNNLLEYLELESSPTLVKAMLQRATNETPELIYHRTSRDVSSSIGRWKYDLDSTLQSVCQKHFGTILQTFGYNDFS